MTADMMALYGQMLMVSRAGMDLQTDIWQEISH